MRRVLIVLAVLAAGVPVHAAPQHIDLIAPVDGPIVRHFEPPPEPYASGHRGLDFQADGGSPVVAAAAGIVAFAGQVGGRLFVSIDHPEGVRSTYSYLDAVLTAAGEQVEQGDLIAASGAGHDPAGSSPHLHFGLREGSTYLDPEPYLVESLRRNPWRVVSLTA